LKHVDEKQEGALFEGPSISLSQLDQSPPVVSRTERPTTESIHRVDAMANRIVPPCINVL